MTDMPQPNQDMLDKTADNIRRGEYQTAKEIIATMTDDSKTSASLVAKLRAEVERLRAGLERLHGNVQQISGYDYSAPDDLEPSMDEAAALLAEARQ